MLSRRPRFHVDQIDHQKAVRFMEEIREIALSADLLHAVEGYERVGHRNAFLWRWVRRGVEITTLPSVQSALWNHVCDTKTLGVVFDVLLDDVADVDADTTFLEILISITERKPRPSLDGLTPRQRDLFEYTEKIWNLIWSRLQSYPHFEVYRDILAFDFKQLLNSMRYSALIKGHPAMMNISEHDYYLPHNMHMMVSGTIDLMASPEFDRRELGVLRKALLIGQHMGRIGNLVTTWEREIREKDYSSGIFPLALSLGVVSVEELEEGDQEKIAGKIRAANLERRFLHRWEILREKLIGLEDRVKTVELGRLLDGLETLIQLHLGSRGLK